MDSTMSWASVPKSEQIAMLAYWHDIDRKKPTPQGLFDFINQIQERVTVYEVPLDWVQDESSR